MNNREYEQLLNPKTSIVSVKFVIYYNVTDLDRLLSCITLVWISITLLLP